MKQLTRVRLFSFFIIVLMVVLIALYLCNVLIEKQPVTKNLFRLLAAVCICLSSLIRLHKSTGRKPLSVYEKAYENDIGVAFQNQPMFRKKLLCACRLYDESHYQKALKYLYQLLDKAEVERDATAVLLFMALCYTDAGLPDEAMKVYGDLLKIYPKHHVAHSNLGSLYIAVGKFDMAIQHFGAAIDSQPQYYAAFINRANCYFRMCDYEKACMDAKKALEIKNNGTEAASLLAVIYALQNDEEQKAVYFHRAVTSGMDPQELNEEIAYFANGAHEQKQER